MSPRQKVLVVDVGGSNVKVLATGEREPRKAPSGPTLTPRRMVSLAKSLARGWKYDVVAVGYPGPVLNGRPISQPKNLGRGWVGFDFDRAFGKPVRALNDAAMQALGSYQGGRMLFLGLGTGLGSALIADGIVEPLELAHLPYKARSFEDYVGLRGLRRLGERRWRKEVHEAIARLRSALLVDYVVLGGGNARLIDKLPDGALLGDNANAFRGGFMLWSNARRRLHLRVADFGSRPRTAPAHRKTPRTRRRSRSSSGVTR
jgi:polyphosphate glucokinase